MNSDDKTRAQDPHEIPTGSYQAVPPPNSPAAMIGRMLKKAYRIDALLGEGGMGVVYKATQIALGRAVAVKTILPSRTVSETTIERFFREAKLLSQLHHPNIVQIIDFGSEVGPIYFMVMELLQGETLETFVETRGTLSPETILDLMEQICAGVSAAHHQGAIHRDLKPANIFVLQVTGSTRPLVKVLDFGLGKMLTTENVSQPVGLTREGVMMGTCGYSAPEQMQGGEVDVRADIYGLGAILYFLAAGRAPYTGESFATLLTAQFTRPPDPLDPDRLDLPGVNELETVIHKAMSVQPDQRHASAQELLEDVAQALYPGETLTDRPVRTSRLGRTLVPRKSTLWTRRNLLLAGGSASALLGAGLAGWFYTRPRKPRATAPGVTSEQVTVGLSGPFLGLVKELGLGIKAGIETCFEEVNAAGGVAGRKLHLVPLDDRYEPDRTRWNMKRLLDEYQVFAFLGNVGTPTAAVAVPLAQEHDRVFFGALSGSQLLRKDPPDRLVFNYRASYREETAAIVHYLRDQRRVSIEKIAVFAQQDRFGDDGFHGVERAVRKAGGDPRRIIRVGYARGSLNITPAVEAIVKARDRIQAVVMVATYEQATRFILGVRNAGMKDVIMSNVSFVGSRALAEELKNNGGEQYCRGLIVTQVVPHYKSAATGVLRYRRALKEFLPSESPGFVSLEGYIAATIFVEGLKRAGENLTTETLIEALESIHDLDLAIGTKIKYGPSDHQGSHKVWGTQLDAEGLYHELELD